MQTLSRRSFVRGLATAPLGLWLSSKVYAATPYTRYDLASPQGQDMLRIFASAVKAMKARSDKDPKSWKWQWYSHFVSGATTKSSELQGIFGSTVTTQSLLANEMWNTCQSHSGQNANHFLPWHRIFVYYLEQIVREVSARPDFTLPYWNYTSYDPAKRGIVPRQFRLSSDPVFGALYRSDRTSLANSGQPIHKNQPGDVMDVSTAMAKRDYSSVGDVQGFCRAIDSGIHGRIHTLVGTSRNMGAVPYAAQDPLFWVHHVNIDRLWASWNLNGNGNPTSGSWRDKSFVFADRTGQRVTARLRDFFDTTTLGYDYDRYVASNGRDDMAAKLFAAAVKDVGRVPEHVGMADSADLGAKPIRKLLKLDKGKPSNVLDPSHQRRTYLVLKDLHTWSQPEVLYHLYITPRGAAPTPDTYVGNINFFDAEFHDHGHGENADALGENFYSFDVTDLLQRLAAGRAGRSNAPLELVIVPGGTPTPGAKPLVATIRLVWQ